MWGVLGMAKQWDSLMKLLVEANKQDLVSLLLPGAKFERELNNEMQSRTLEADLLYIVNWNGIQVILHVEFQKRRDGNMGRRLWEYNAQTTIISGLPVCSFVIYLQRDGSLVQSPYELPRPNGKAIHLFFFDTVKLWEIPGGFLKQEGIEGLLPLLPLTQDGVRHEVVNDMIVSLDLAGKNDLLPLAYAFASLVFKNAEDRDWLRKRFTMLSEDIFEDSWAYQEMLAKGMEKGRREGELQALREVIMDVVQDRFPQIAALVSNHIQKIDDPGQLRRLNVKVSAAQTARQAEQAVLSNTENGQQH